MKFLTKIKEYFLSNNKKLIPYIIVLTILLLGVGYSAFSSNLSVRDLYAEVRVQKDIRVTGVSVTTETVGSTTYLDYNVSNIQAGINLPNEYSSVTFNVQLTNIGSAEVGIKEINGLADNLDYEILNYNLKDKICDENNICKLGIQKEIQVQIKYKDGGYDSSNTQYNIVANFDFQRFYSVTYTDIEGSEYPAEILGGETLTVDFGDIAPKNISIKINNVETNDYTYEYGLLEIPNVSGNVEIKNEPPICTLVSGEPNIVGSKYQCKVKDNMEEDFEEGYYFFVLSHNDDGTTNLIMERNICEDGTLATADNKCLVGWYLESQTNLYGPVTAMTYLNNSTKNWDNIPNIIIDYKDEGNKYGLIKTEGIITIITKSDLVTTTASYQNLKARLPLYNEIHGEGKCLSYAENGNKYGSCPLWLANYLKSSSHVKGDGVQSIANIYGYWTLSSRANSANNVYFVNYNGDVYYYNSIYQNYVGVRPVINIKL